MARSPTPSNPSLTSTVESVLKQVEVPVPTAAMRALASTLRDEPVSAERLARVASSERENFLRTRQPPRLCSAIFPDGTTPSRRVWASGGWRLARRVIAADAQPAWFAAVGIFVCDLILDHAFTDERLGPLAHDLAARSIGPVAGYYPGSQHQWEELRGLLRRVPVGPGVATHTVEQGEAEAALEAAELTPFSLYFGLDGSAGIPRHTSPAGLRLALQGEPGAIPFDEMVHARADDPAEARDVLAYVEAYSRQLDELGRPPSQAEFAERWNLDLASAGAERSKFTALFPGKDDAEAIAGMLWDGIGRGPGLYTRLLGVKVIPSQGFPTVIACFLSCIADELRDGTGAAALTEAMVFEETPPLAGQELRRFFALCARAVDVWCADAFASTGDEPSLLGLRSLETVTDEGTAAYTEQLLGEYRRAAGQREGKSVVLATQKALRVAASLRRLEPPQTTLPYLDGIRWAAKALVAAQRELGLDLVAEAKRTTQRLDAVYI